MILVSCMTNTHSEKPYCIVAMETNLPASLSVMRFTLEFVLVCASVDKNTDEKTLTGPRETDYIFEAANLYFLFNQSPGVLQISPFSVMKFFYNYIKIYMR